MYETESSTPVFLKPNIVHKKIPWAILVLPYECVSLSVDSNTIPTVDTFAVP